jgi:hypothetical protein
MRIQIIRNETLHNKGQQNVMQWMCSEDACAYIMYCRAGMPYAHDSCVCCIHPHFNMSRKAGPQFTQATWVNWKMPPVKCWQYLFALTGSIPCCCVFFVAGQVYAEPLGALGVCFPTKPAAAQVNQPCRAAVGGTGLLRQVQSHT